MSKEFIEKEVSNQALFIRCINMQDDNYKDDEKINFDFITKYNQYIEKLIEQDNLKATEEVLFELEKKEDDVYNWAKNQSEFFLPLSLDIQISVQEILSAFPTLVDSRRDRSQADPFVIALARVKKCPVVTGEKSSGTSRRPRIPNVCEYFGVKYMNIIDFIREQQWKF